MNVRCLRGLTLTELIRVNKLVRGGVRSAEFESWWNEPGVDRASLIGGLFFCATQAHVDRSVIEQALAASGGREDDPDLSIMVAAVRDPKTSVTFIESLSSTPDDRLLSSFRFAYHLFGVAEGRRIRSEQGFQCTHWWHRDLLNPEVGAELLRADHRDQRRGVTDIRTRSKTRPN